MKKKSKRGRPSKLGATQIVAVRLPLELIEKLKANGEISQQIRSALEASLKLTALVLLIACGDEKRCFTRAEAMMACQVEEISKTSVDVVTAEMLCAPYYPAEMCYSID